MGNTEPLQSLLFRRTDQNNSAVMWKFRISCFVSLCGLLWAAAVASPFQTVEGSLSFLPVLAVLGIVHVVVMMRYVDKAGPGFQKFWVGMICGVVDAAFTLLLLLLATSTTKLGLQAGMARAATIIAWCLAFGVPQLPSPRILAAMLTRKVGEFR